MFARELPSDLTPDAAALRLRLRPGLCWLDGGPDFGDAGRWSFVGSDPVSVIQAAPDDAAPLDKLHELSAPAERGERGARVPGAPDPERVPCWIGSLSYDANSAAGLSPRSPTLWFARHAALLAYDHLHARAFVVGDDDATCDALAARLTMGNATQPYAEVNALCEPPRKQHLAAVARALEHIAAGDIYQVNLARRWSARLAGDPLALFLAMKKHSPVPLGFYQMQNGRQLLGRSMECFLDWQGPGATLLSRPIKGTRSRTTRDAAQVAAELREDPKERAEHTMIIDLMRNDLGRVAQVGSVEVSERMRVEPYAGLSHLVSTVRCTSRAELTLAELIGATFPPGSVTGTPKRRAMQILEGLEGEPRGPYTGALGHVSRAGGARFAVAIRTAVVEDGAVSYWAGGGIVADSDPERELAETELKARVFLDALTSLG